MSRNGMNAATIVIERLMTMTVGAERKKVSHADRKTGDVVDVESKDDVTVKSTQKGDSGKGEETPFPAASSAIEKGSVNLKTKTTKKAAEPGEGDVIASEIKGTKGRRFVFQDE